jgi:drug/metabolite transporter (DMT)-like permease
LTNSNENSKSHRRATLTGLALVIVPALLMSTKGILAKFMYETGMGVEELLFLRSAIALPLFWIFALWKLGLLGTLRANRKDFLAAFFVGVFTYYVGAVADFEALQLIDASIERIILFAYPAMVVLAEAVRRRAMPPRAQMIAMLLTYAGIYLAMGAFNSELFQANLVGALLALVAAITFAVYLMVNQQTSGRIGSVRFTTYAMTGAAAGLTVHFLTAAPPEVFTFTSDGWWMLVVMAVFVTVVPFLLLAEGIRRIGASRAALITTIGPPVTLVLAFFLLGESMTWIQLAGSALVILGVLVLERPQSKRVRQSET